MHLANLHLINFKNISELEIQFSKGINGIVGENGAGKSTFIEFLTGVVYS